MANFKDNERYVITGMGLVSPIGNDPDTAFRAALNKKNGVENVRDTLFAGYESLPIHVAAPVKSFDLLDDPAFITYRKEIIGKWDLSQQFILWAGAQALRQSGLLPEGGLKVEKIEPERFGVYVGTGVGGADILTDVRYTLEQERLQYLEAQVYNDKKTMDGLREDTRVNAKSILKALPGRVAGTPSMVFNAKAFWRGILQECASGNAAIIAAVEAIKLGKADVVLAGGTEGAITVSTIGAFGAARAVTRERNPDIASRPFDKSRKGLVYGQGAGAVIVEGMDHALNRGAPILAEIVGYAENADAMYETEPDPVNVAKCIHKAVEMTREKRPTGVVLNNHGTSTPIGDPAEMTAEANVFEHRQVVGIAAIKSNTGHMLGASGAAEGVMSVKTLEYGMTPPIRNLEDPIDEAKGYEHLMSNEAPIEADIKYVVNNSFGFGGNNAVTIFSKPC